MPGHGRQAQANLAMLRFIPAGLCRMIGGNTSEEAAMSKTLFRNARVLDGSGDAPFAGDVLVEGNRIAAVAPAGTLAPPPDAALHDCAGATLMPGLIEPHTHLSFVDQAHPNAFSQLA